MAPPPISGVHHLKFPVGDLDRSREWYESVLGLSVEMEFRDDDGVVRGVAGALADPSGIPFVSLALRQNPEASAGLGGFDPLSLSVPSRADLEAWADHLVSFGYERPSLPTHGDPEAEVAVLALHDPDGHEIRLFGPAR